MPIASQTCRAPHGRADRNPILLGRRCVLLVAPRTGAWIETETEHGLRRASAASRPVRARGLKQVDQRGVQDRVAPRTGAWIETRRASVALVGSASRPVRARGLKPLSPWRRRRRDLVAPRTGAWIETRADRVSALGGRVAPRTGAWIETQNQVGVLPQTLGSRPVRARGLKLQQSGERLWLLTVAPRTGAWIETLRCMWLVWLVRRALYGRVD